MTSRIFAFLFFALALLAGAMAPAFAPAAEGPEEAFTRRFAERFEKALPGHEIEITEPLQLRVVTGGDPVVVNFGRIFNFCSTAPAEECDDAIDRFIASTTETVARMETGWPAVTSEQLRVAVRHTDFCDYVAQSSDPSSPAGEVMLTRPYVAPLCLVLMADYPTQMRGVRTEDLAGLGMDADAAWALAERQTLADLPEPDGLDSIDESLIAVTEYDYVTSLLLNNEGWRRAAAAVGGHLLVAVPSDQYLIVARQDVISDMAGFRRNTRETFETAERGISPLIYRWTASGWVPLD